MRKIIDKYFFKYGIKNYVRRTITYCQYGLPNMKPTDIWTNDFDWIPRKRCHNGDSCHERQPRSYRAKKAFNALGKGTQGLRDAQERGRIPRALFIEIFRSKASKESQAQLMPLIQGVH